MVPRSRNAMTTQTLRLKSWTFGSAMVLRWVLVSGPIIALAAATEGYPFWEAHVRPLLFQHLQPQTFNMQSPTKSSYCIHSGVLHSYNDLFLLYVLSSRRYKPMFTCTAGREYRLILVTWRSCFIFETNFLRKSDGLLLVIEHGKKEED